MLNFFLLTQTVLRVKSNLKMFMENLLGTNICSTLAVFQKTESFMIVKIKWSLAE